MRISTILVEDEKIIMERMEKLLEDYRDILDIKAKAYTCKDAVRLIDAHEPDLIFLDIELSDGDGFSILRSIKARPFVVFVTGFNQYALKAFENYSLDYIVKPVSEDRLKLTIDKIKMTFKEEKTDELMTSFNRKLMSFLHQEVVKIPIKTPDGYDFVNINDILYVKAEDKYVRIYTRFDDYLSDYSLKQLEEKFTNKFIKIHRNTIVNKEKITSLKKWFKGRYKVILEDESEHEVSTRKFEEVKKQILIDF